jgi:MoaA/NifB/PqqE/SkfB family radical SAM enzyme
MTNQCNLRCPFCSDGAGNPYYTHSDDPLSADKVKELLCIIRSHTDSIILTGGEPLLHPEFSEIMKIIKAIGFKQVVLTTNGYHLDTYLSKIADSVTYLTVSMNSLNRDMAEKLSGNKKDAFSVILNNIDKAAIYKKRKYSMIISSVVTPENIADLYTVYKFARERNAIFAACPQLVGVKAHKDLPHNREYVKFYDFLIDEKKRGGRIYGSPLYLEYMRDLKKFDCHPLTLIALSPAGDLFYPCLERGNFAGNLLEEKNLHALLQKGRELHGPLPECDNRCHSACALGFALLIKNPLSMAGESF